jgi:hypothetical protein
MSQQMIALLVPDMPVTTPDARRLHDLLTLLDVCSCTFVEALEKGSGEWDCNGFDYRERLGLIRLRRAEFVQFAALHAGHYVHAEIDGMLARIAASLPSRYPEETGNWRPACATIGVGPHSFPNLEHDGPVWRGSISMGIYGDGIANLDQMQDALARDKDWQLLRSRVAIAVGLSIRTELVAYY